MKWLDDRSRMKREFHVRFCESLRGKYFGLLDYLTITKALGQRLRNPSCMFFWWYYRYNSLAQ